MNTDSNAVTIEPRGAVQPSPTRAGPCYRPRVDIRESERELQILADLPGARAESIDVHCENGLLTLTAKVEPRATGERNELLREYEVGDFRRVFQLDERIDVSRISAEYAQGVLTLRLPKLETARSMKVSITSG